MPGNLGASIFDDAPSRRLRSELLTSEKAFAQAKAFDRTERDKETS